MLKSIGRILRHIFTSTRSVKVKIIPFTEIRDMLYADFEQIQFAELLIPEDSHVGITYIENGRLVAEPDEEDGLEGITFTAFGTPCLHIVMKNGLEKFLAVYRHGVMQGGALCVYINPLSPLALVRCYSITKNEFKRLQAHAI